MSVLKTAATQVWKKSLLNQFNVTNLRVTDTPFWTAKFTIPGLSHESFDRDGNPKLTSLMLTSVISRSHVMNRPYSSAGHVFLDWSTITKNNFTFVSSTQFTMSRSLYSPEVLKQPLDVEFVMGYVRNSSMGSVSHFYNSGKTVEEPLWTQMNQLVYIDRETRKPTALPDWYKNKYKDKGCMEKPVFFNPLDHPSPTYKQSVVVQWSDTDNFNHTNFASYVHWAINAIHHAIMLRDTYSNTATQSNNTGATSVGASPVTSFNATASGAIAVIALPGISKDIITNGLKDVQIRYFKESVEGQTLDVHLWQKQHEDNIVYSSVVRDGEDLCQIKLEYFHSVKD